MGALTRAALAVWLLAPAMACAAPAEPSTPVEPQVMAAFVDPSEKLYVWRDVRLTVSLVNATGRIGVDALRITVPTIGLESTDNAIDVPIDKFQMLTPGERRDFDTVVVKPVTFRGLLHASTLGLLAYRPRKEVFLVTVKYKPLDDADSPARLKTARLEANVTAHPLGMYAGALVGVLLATLLVHLYRRTRNDAAEGAPLWLQILRGATASLIAILIFQTTSDFSFPISITVHDFYGGALLGLFGDKVAEAILKRI